MVVFEIRKDGQYIGAFRIGCEDFNLFEVVGDLDFDCIGTDDLIGTDEPKLVFEIKPLEEIARTMNENPSKGIELNKQLEEMF